MNGAFCHLVLRCVDDEKSATLPGQFGIFHELGRFPPNFNRIEIIYLRSHILQQDFLFVVVRDVFLAEAVAKQRLTRLLSIRIGRESRYDMPRRTKIAERPWETRLRQSLHLIADVTSSPTRFVHNYESPRTKVIANPFQPARSIPLVLRETNLPNPAREFDLCFQTTGRLSMQLCRAIPEFPCSH
jgi:hypothetical protein